MSKREKKLGRSESPYYFGGPVPRDIQWRLQPCLERGMTVQNIARKLAYLWLALPVEKQNQLYFSLIDADFDPQDKAVADLFRLVDEIMASRILTLLPESKKRRPRRQ